MYLKLSAINEEFQLLFIDEEGSVEDTDLPILVKLYNKVGRDYQLFQTETASRFEYQNSNLTDKRTVFADVYVDSVPLKTKIKVEVITTEVRIKYKLNYETTYPFRELSTTFLRRVSLGMPSWSTAYKNDVSIFSKVFYPLYLIPERIYYKTKEALHNNLTNDTYTKPILTKGTVSVAKREDGSIIPRTFIKEKEMINKVTTEKINQKNINLFSLLLDGTVTYPIKLDPTFNKIFVRSDKSCLIHVSGINKRRLPINEYIYCDGVVYTSSFLEYKEINEITLVKISGYEDPKIEITNHMNLKKYQSNFRTNLMTGTPDDNKDFEVPLYLYTYETDMLKTFYAKEWLQEEDGSIEYFVPALRGNNGFFVTEDDDIISLSSNVTLGAEETDDILLTEINQKMSSETNLYRINTGLLRRNIEVDLELHSSNNNNSLVTILDENSAATTGNVEVQILTKDIVENYGNVSVQISVNIDGSVYYLNDFNDWVEEPVYKLLNNTNPIYVEQDVKNSTYFSVVMEFNTVKYQASFIKHRVNLVPQDVFVSEAYHNGTNLIVKKDNEYHTLNFEKDYYEFRNDNSIQYDGYNKNITLLDERGYTDGDYSNSAT